MLWEIVSHTYSRLGATSVDTWNFAKKRGIKIPKFQNEVIMEVCNPQKLPDFLFSVFSV
jgi:hypothetical protein